MKLRIVIRGKVHEVDYRPFLLGLAESLEIERFFADNILIDGKQAVGILWMMKIPRLKPSSS